MNLGSALCGGVPMCHGAGGMAGHVAFGARTGGAPIILGTILLGLALCFGSSIEAILGFFPKAVLGVILFLTGAQLALGSCDFSKNKVERFVDPRDGRIFDVERRPRVPGRPDPLLHRQARMASSLEHRGPGPIKSLRSPVSSPRASASAALGHRSYRDRAMPGTPCEEPAIPRR